MAKYRINPIAALYHLVKNDVQKLEYDPKSQFDFHRRMSFFWIANFAGVLTFDIFINPFWQKISILYLTLVSLYANFSTDYGAMPSAHAALTGDQIKAAQDAKQAENDKEIAPSRANF
jgi:hypothetical protein